MSLVTSAIDHIGPKKVSDAVGLYPSAITKWKQQGRLPRTELAGLTTYADTLERLSAGKYPASALIEETRKQWKRRMRERRVDA